MKAVVFLLFAAATISLAEAADEPNTNSITAAEAAPAGSAPAVVPKPTALTPEDRAHYASLARQESELSAQLKLLTELSEEHLRRAEDATKAGTAEKAQWETDLAQELRNKNSLTLEQLNEVTKQRLAFEMSHPPASLPGLGALNDRKPLTPEEFAYVSKLEERLLKIRQELVATDAAARGLYLDLQTNKTTEVVAQISNLLEDNARQTRQWEKEQFELELKKLEFRALRK